MITISFSFAVKVAPATAPAMVIETTLFAVFFGFMVVGCFPSFESVAMPNITTAARRWSGRGLQHLRQVGADQVASFMQGMYVALGAVASEVAHPLGQVASAPVLLDQLGDVVAPLAVASGALDAEHVPAFPGCHQRSESHGPL